MYDFFLDRILLPIAPARLELAIKNQNRTLTLIDFGEINVLKQAGLTDIQFMCLIPQTHRSYAVYSDGFKDATYFLAAFERLKTSEEPFQFIVSRTRPNGALLFDNNLTVTLERYSIVEDWAENEFDLAIQIELKQWRWWGTKEIEIVEDADGTPTAVIYENRPPDMPQTGDIRVGDVVQFLGGHHFMSSTSVNPSGSERRSGSALCTHVVEGAPQPYHLKGGAFGGVDGNSNVYGWVAAGQAHR